MIKVWKNVEHGMAGEGSEVPDGLHPRYGPTPVSERFCTGPMS